MENIVELVRVSTPRCFHCGQKGSLTVQKSQLDAYLAGAYVQDAFVGMNADDREQIMTGMHPACWDEMMGPEPD